jgi:hypothetical protein
VQVQCQAAEVGDQGCTLSQPSDIIYQGKSKKHKHRPGGGAKAWQPQASQEYPYMPLERKVMLDQRDQETIALIIMHVPCLGDGWELCC